MPRKCQIATIELLKSIPLPSYIGGRYTTISHETVIVNAKEQLKLKGFKIESEKYRCNGSGEIASGMYNLTYGNDPELGMMFAWTNSYDKSTRFKSAVGGFIKVSDSYIIGDFNWSRKHTGTADQEMIAQVNNQIVNGQIYYDQIVAVKEQMKSITVPKDGICKFLGIAFFQKDLFSKDQICTVRDEMLKPSFVYDTNPESLWTYYNYMLVALKEAHPRTWMDEQRDLHKYVCQEFGISFRLNGTVITTTASGISDGDPTATNGSTGISSFTTNNVGPATVIQVTPNPGPVNIYSEQEDEKPIEKMNLEELAEVLVDKEIEKQLQKVSEDLLIKGESKFKVTINGPDTEFSDITPEDQALIDERIAAMSNPKTKVKPANLNLPD